AYVPNFIGGSLPRRDAGNREQYCMTMLTLFKPWRTGQDLRPSQDVLWDDVFNGHSFNEWLLEVMKFFNIRYECNNARDDFSAARRKGGKTSPSPFNMDDATHLLRTEWTEYYKQAHATGVSLEPGTSCKSTQASIKKFWAMTALFASISNRGKGTKDTLKVYLESPHHPTIKEPLEYWHLRL
ncbi:hypothetical protein TRAPUB_8204, partial [Trametes pubescens]